MIDVKLIKWKLCSYFKNLVFNFSWFLVWKKKGEREFKRVIMVEGVYEDFVLMNVIGKVGEKKLFRLSIFVV